jgi:hypothetical protein
MFFSISVQLLDIIIIVKKMNKILLSVVVVALAHSSYGQKYNLYRGSYSAVYRGSYYSRLHGYNRDYSKRFQLGAGIESYVPIGHFSKYSSFGWGASARGEFKPHKRLGITGTARYVEYSGKTINKVNFTRFNYYTAMVGLKNYPGQSARLFVHWQAGIGIGASGLGSSFWYGAGVGTDLSRIVDLELGYMGWQQSEVMTKLNNDASQIEATRLRAAGYGGHHSTIGLRLGVKF